MSAPSDLLFTSSRRGSDAAAAAAKHQARCLGPDGVFDPTALLALAAAIQAAPAGAEAPAAAPSVAAASPRGKINPSKRVLRFVVPLTDNGNYLGDVDLAVDPQDRLSVKTERLLQMLEPIVKPEVFARLRAGVASKSEITEAQLAAEQITLAYDNDKLALAIGIPVASRRKAFLSLGGSAIGVKSATLQPAAFSAFVNFRSTVDLIEQGQKRGFVAPLSGIDWAARVFGVVAEGEGYISLRKGDPRVSRTGSRLVYDDLKHVVRFAAGDVRPFGRTFQSTPTVAGLSASRFYNVLEPWQEYRSTGTQSFTILAPSTVETIVNGRSVELRTLQPGSFTLSDFPLADGSNDVQLRIKDLTGKERVVHFDLYSNRQLLDPGRTEFSAFAGVYSNPTRADIRYTRDWNANGFVRRGLSQQLTAGANMQGDARAQQLGMEILFGSGAGLIGVELAGSRRVLGGRGFAAAVSYEKTIGSGGQQQHSIRGFLEYRSALFAVPGALIAREPTQLRGSLGYAVTLGLDRFLAFDAQYSRDRLLREIRYGVRASGGLRLAEALGAVAEVQWDRGGQRRGVVARIGLRKRFGSRSTAQFDVDNKGAARGTFQTAGGRGIGAWSGSADLSRTPAGSTLNAGGSLVTNRAELALTQIASYDQGGRRISDVRTSVRAGSSIAFADGHFAIGRPIQEAFLVATPHRSLGKNSIHLNPQEKSEEASSGSMGSALAGSLSAYSPRLLVYDVPGAPSGYDLGAGNVQIVPPYKSGYHLEIGSDYHLLVIGRLIDREGQPISLLAGKATDLNAPKRASVTMFTSRGGKFGAQGLRPGRWRIEMPTDGEATIYEIDIKDDPSGTVRVGDLHPRARGDAR